MVWFWPWHENRFIKKIEQGVVFYKKSFNNTNQSDYKQHQINRRLETKKVRTHDKK